MPARVLGTTVGAVTVPLEYRALADRFEAIRDATGRTSDSLVPRAIMRGIAAGTARSPALRRTDPMKSHQQRSLWGRLVDEAAARPAARGGWGSIGPPRVAKRGRMRPAHRSAYGRPRLSLSLRRRPALLRLANWTAPRLARIRSSPNCRRPKRRNWPGTPPTMVERQDTFLRGARLAFGLAKPALR